MQTFSLPKTTSKPIPALGIGGMPFSRPGRDLDESISIIHFGLNHGMTLLNTADVYAPSAEEMGHNEKLMGEALRQWDGDQSKVIVVTKNGITRSKDQWNRNGSKEYLLRAAEKSNKELGMVPDLLLHHRIDQSRSFTEQAQAMLAVLNAGLTKKIGFSNIKQSEYEIAQQETHGQVSAVENERSPRYRSDVEVLESCTKDQIVYLAWSPLGGENDAKNLGTLYPEFNEVARDLEVTAQQVALAWLRTHSNVLVPIPGFTKIKTAESTIASADLTLSNDQIALLNSSKPGNGSVYPS
jgi:aryl-alcohol dehydrogenase-like predicted oxidoreductase